jgi:glutaredoxin
MTKSLKQSLRRTVSVTLALIVASSLPAAADWLVTRDAHRIETRGPWKVKGRTVVYTDVKGTLSSLRLDEVDLEASKVANEEPEPPPPAAPEPEPEKQAPVLVLTNKDIPRAREIMPAAQVAPAPTLIMYSTDWCGVCRRARRLLAELNADYIEKDIDKSPAARREYIAKFGSEVRIPAFDYSGEVSRGLDPATLRKWVAEMKARENAREGGAQ